MKLSDKEIGILIVGGAFVLAVCFIAHSETGQQAQPRYEGELATAGLSNVAIDHLNTGDHYFHPGYCVPGQSQIFTPHRYPKVSGSNVTTLIHRGFSAMRRPAPQDSDWFLDPPAEVMF